MGSLCRPQYGRIIRETTGTTEKKLARDILAKKKVAVAEGRHLEKKRAPRTTFYQLCDHYWEMKGKRLSMKGLPSMLDIWKKHFGNIPVREISLTRIEKFLNAHIDQGGLSLSTRNRHLGQLKAMFNWGTRWTPERKEVPLVTDNPAAAIKKVNEQKMQRQRFLESEEIERLLSACSGGLRPLVIAALHTGCAKVSFLA